MLRGKGEYFVSSIDPLIHQSIYPISNTSVQRQTHRLRNKQQHQVPRRLPKKAIKYGHPSHHRKLSSVAPPSPSSPTSTVTHLSSPLNQTNPPNPTPLYFPETGRNLRLRLLLRNLHIPHPTPPPAPAKSLHPRRIRNRNRTRLRIDPAHLRHGPIFPPRNDSPRFYIPLPPKRQPFYDPRPSRRNRPRRSRFPHELFETRNGLSILDASCGIRWTGAFPGYEYG